ncbi:MAG: hypothetical protein SGI77_24815 [Pirellulaceae bacterium]|nr:hypothetical protein [Pirellulaceae bacterium]
MSTFLRGGRSTRLKRLAFQAVFAASLGVPVIVISEEVKIELRKRTDSSVQSDIQAALEYQREFLGSTSVNGLSDLAQRAPSQSISSPESKLPLATSSTTLVPGIAIPCSPIVIGIDSESLSAPPITRSSPPIIISAGPTTQVLRSDVVRQLPPPAISPIKDWKSEHRTTTLASLDSSTRQWKPVRAVIAANDVEATIRPLLSGSSVSVGSLPSSSDSSVVPANFQAPADGFNAPVLPNRPIVPNSGALNSGPAIMPNTAPGAVYPPANVQPYPPSNVQPYPQGNLPTYPQGSLPTYGMQGSSIINGEPFVTAPPCQFDAYNMLEPMMSTDCGTPSYRGCSAGPTYGGLPGTYAPSTIMPNQVPGLYSSNNSGFRPLIGFGQDRYNVQLGRGIIGQPVAYVPGQPLRNFLRYIFP